jgi:hypothetical protein
MATRIGFSAAIMAACLSAVLPLPVLAQDRHPAPPPAPLKPGQSAGIHIAQQTRTGLALVGTGAVLAVVIVVATASNSGGGATNQPNSQSTTTTTAP